MKSALLKAKARKQKFNKRKEEVREEDDSDASMSDEEEELYSENMVGKLANGKYLIVKYLGKGSFSKVWLVLDMIIQKYYALKIQESKYNEDMDEELKILNHLQKGITVESADFSKYNFGLLIDNFDTKINETICRCMVLELLGSSIAYLSFEENIKCLTIPVIKKVIYDMAKGLQQIHNSGIIHTDLKPDNVLFRECNHDIRDYIDNVNQLGIGNTVEELMSNNTPKEIMMLPKNKRKIVKRKIRLKTVKEAVKLIHTEIINLNKEEVSENNLELKIEELNLELDELEDNNSDFDRKDILELDLDNLCIKIIDFGNAEFKNRLEQEEIYTRSYRPPENIINNTYSSKSDIWFVGCFLYELLTGEILFDINCIDNNPFIKDREHLSVMYSYLGKMSRDMTMNCEFSEDLFDSKGRIIKNRDIEEIDLRSELTSRIDIDEEELDLIEDLIFKILEYDPNNRLSAEGILRHKWFRT